MMRSLRCKTCSVSSNLEDLLLTLFRLSDGGPSFTSTQNRPLGRGIGPDAPALRVTTSHDFFGPEDASYRAITLLSTSSSPPKIVSPAEAAKAKRLLNEIFDDDSDGDSDNDSDAVDIVALKSQSSSFKVSSVRRSSPRFKIDGALETFKDKYASVATPKLKSKTTEGYVATLAHGGLDTSALESIDESTFPKLFVCDSSPPPRPSINKDPRKHSTVEETYTGEEEDVAISEHNVILSSSPIKENDYTSSIGSIRAAKPSKSVIPPMVLQKAKAYDYDKRLMSSEKSNRFLDKLISNASSTRERYEKQRREREKEIQARATSIPSSSPASSPARSTPSKRPATYEGITAVDLEPSRMANVASLARPAARSKTGSVVQAKAQERAQNKATKQQHRDELRRLKEANKVTRTKEQLLDEMIMDIPKIVFSTIKHKKCESELDGIETRESFREDPYVSWQRKVTSKYDTVTDSFIPTSPHVIDEGKCCLVYNVKDFASMMQMETLLSKFKKFRRDHPEFDCIVIMIVEWEQLIQRLKNAENRQYTARMRDGEPEPQKKKRKASVEDSLSLKEMEDTISELQVAGFRIFTTKSIHESTIWLKSFTHAIAGARYDKLERNPEFANVGAIKSGKDSQDTYFQMLLQLKFMTEVRAQRVMSVMPTLKSLHKCVKSGRLPLGKDGKTAMNSNVEASVIKLLTTKDDDELLNTG